MSQAALDFTPDNDNAPKDERRSETLPVLRVKPSEKAKILQNVQAAGLSYSEYARMLLLSGKPEIVKKTVTVDPKIKSGLEGAWNNLNQLTRKLHMLDVDDPGRVDDVLAQAEDVLGQHERLFDWILAQLPTP